MTYEYTRNKWIEARELTFHRIRMSCSVTSNSSHGTFRSIIAATQIPKPTSVRQRLQLNSITHRIKIEAKEEASSAKALSALEVLVTKQRDLESEDKSFLLVRMTRYPYIIVDYMRTSFYDRQEPIPFGSLPPYINHLLVLIRSSPSSPCPQNASSPSYLAPLPLTSTPSRPQLWPYYPVFP